MEILGILLTELQCLRCLRRKIDCLTMLWVDCEYICVLLMQCSSGILTPLIINEGNIIFSSFFNHLNNEYEGLMKVKQRFVYF